MIPPTQKLMITNKTMKTVTLLSQESEPILILQPGEVHSDSDYIDFTWHDLTIKFEHSIYE